MLIKNYINITVQVQAHFKTLQVLSLLIKLL